MIPFKKLIQCITLNYFTINWQFLDAGRNYTFYALLDTISYLNSTEILTLQSHPYLSQGNVIRNLRIYYATFTLPVAFSAALTCVKSSKDVHLLFGNQKIYY